MFFHYGCGCQPATTTTSAGLTEQQVRPLIEAAMQSSGDAERDIDVRTLTTDISLGVTARHVQVIRTNGANRIVRCLANTSFQFRNDGPETLTIQNPAGTGILSLAAGESGHVHWDVETSQHYVTLGVQAANQVSYLTVDVTSGNQTFAFIPSDGDLTYIHRRDTASTSNTMTIDVSSTPGLLIYQNDTLLGTSVSSNAPGEPILFKRIGSRLEVLSPILTGSVVAGSTARAVLTISGTVAAGTTISVNSPGTNIGFSGATTINLGASAAQFNSDVDCNILLNGVELTEGVDVVWVSQTSFRLPSTTLYAGDQIEIEQGAGSA